MSKSSSSSRASFWSNQRPGRGSTRLATVERLRNVYSDLLNNILLDSNATTNEDQRYWEEGSPRLSRSLKKWIRSSSTSSSSLFGFVDQTPNKKTLPSQPRQPQNAPRAQEAFASLAATRTAENAPTVHFGDPEAAERAAERQNVALCAAKALQHQVVQQIQTMGDMLIQAVEHQQECAALDGDAPLRCDDMFEYFCDKSILQLLVDVVQAQPGDSQKFGGVVWTAAVKAQALHTVSRLVSTLRDPAALYYILSQNCLNELIMTVLPLSQWTDPALEAMLPPYVELLKNLALVLSDSPQLFCFFLIEEAVPNHEDEDEDEDEDQSSDQQQRDEPNDGEVACSRTNNMFPLFSATLETGTSPFAESNSFLHATCLNLVVDLMQIQDPAIQMWVKQDALTEQLFLANHLCDLLLRRYHRMANLTNGPVVDSIRSTALVGQIEGLNDQLDLLNDIFDCGIPSLNIRLCELLLERFVSVLWRDVSLSDMNSHQTTSLISVPPVMALQTFFDVGMMDLDVIPEREALAQVALFVLGAVFYRLRYRPLARMLAIALFHPQTTHLFTAGVTEATNEEGELFSNSLVYRYTPDLHRIAQGGTGHEKVAGEQDSVLVDNCFRAQVLKAISGEFGEWFAITSSILLEQMMESPCLDSSTISALQLTVPLIPREGLTLVGGLDQAIGTYLKRQHIRKSDMSSVTLECVTSLAIHFIQKSAVVSCHSKAGEGTATASKDIQHILSSTTVQELKLLCSTFFQKALESNAETGANDLFVEHFEAAVQKQYKQITFRSSDGIRRSSTRSFAYQLSQRGCTIHGNKAECLVRKIRSSSSSQTEEARWNALMAMHLRAINRVLHIFLRELQSELSQPKVSPLAIPKLELLDRGEDLLQIFSTQLNRPIVGADVELTGRTTFSFTTEKAANISDSAFSEQILSEEIQVLRDLNRGLGSKTAFNVLVMDQRHLILVRPLPPILSGKPLQRGRIMCAVPLLHVIAAAVDEDWLHVAVRHDNVRSLIKNGNMVLRFDNKETSITVLSQLVSHRQAHRNNIAQQLKSLSKLKGILSEEPTNDGHGDTRTKNTSEEKKATN